MAKIKIFLMKFGKILARIVKIGFYVWIFVVSVVVLLNQYAAQMTQHEFIYKLSEKVNFQEVVLNNLLQEQMKEPLTIDQKQYFANAKDKLENSYGWESMLPEERIAIKGIYEYASKDATKKNDVIKKVYEVAQSTGYIRNDAFVSNNQLCDVIDYVGYYAGFCSQNDSLTNFNVYEDINRYEELEYLDDRYYDITSFYTLIGFDKIFGFLNNFGG